MARILLCRLGQRGYYTAGVEDVWILSSIQDIILAKTRFSPPCNIRVIYCNLGVKGILAVMKQLKQSQRKPRNNPEGFIAQLVAHPTGISEVMGSNPVDALSQH